MRSRKESERWKKYQPNGRKGRERKRDEHGEEENKEIDIQLKKKSTSLQMDPHSIAIDRATSLSKDFRRTVSGWIGLDRVGFRFRLDSWGLLPGFMWCYRVQLVRLDSDGLFELVTDCYDSSGYGTGLNRVISWFQLQFWRNWLRFTLVLVSFRVVWCPYQVCWISIVVYGFYIVWISFERFGPTWDSMALWFWLTGVFRLILSPSAGLIEFHFSIWGFIGFYWVLLGFTGFHRVLLGFTRFHRVLLGFIWFYWVLLGFTGFYWFFTGYYWVLLGITGFYWVLLGFTGFYWVLRGLL